MAKPQSLARKASNIEVLSNARLRASSGCGLKIDGKIPEGYVVLCTEQREPHSFLVRRLGPSVECPRCGATAISAELMTDFYLGHAAAAQ